MRIEKIEIVGVRVCASGGLAESEDVSAGSCRLSVVTAEARGLRTSWEVLLCLRADEAWAEAGDCAELTAVSGASVFAVASVVPVIVPLVSAIRVFARPVPVVVAVTGPVLTRVVVVPPSVGLIRERKGLRATTQLGVPCE